MKQLLKFNLIAVVGLVLAAALCARASRIYGPVEFMGNVSMGSWTNPVSGFAFSSTTGGIYTNGVYTNFYRVFGTNNSGRIPVSTNLSFSWTGATNGSNAVVLSWARMDGIASYIIEKSFDAGSTFTNWLALGANYTNLIDYGTNAWTSGSATSLWPAIAAPSSPWDQAAADAASATGRVAVLEGKTNTWDQAAVDGASATGRVAAVENKTNSWDQAAIDAVNATGRVTTIEGKTNTWDQAAIDVGSATSRVEVLEGKTNSWDQAAIDAASATGSVFYLDGRYPGNSSVWGEGLNISNIAGGVYPATGSAQHGVNWGTMTIGGACVGCSQWGEVMTSEGSMIIDETSWGCSQRGLVESGTILICSNAAGAVQMGAVGVGSVLNYGAGGALQIYFMDGYQTSLVTRAGAGSIVLGAGTSSSKYAVVIGDGQVSHGAESITAGGGFWDNGVRLPTNPITYVSAPASNTASGSAGQVAWTNADGTNWFLFYDPNGLGLGTSAWVRIQGGASW